jgi:Flp pilus assembly protein TadG
MGFVCIFRAMAHIAAPQFQCGLAYLACIQSRLESFHMNTKKRTQLDGQRGTSSVEFALILPLLMLLICGLIELSIALYDKAVLVNASREGARAGIVLRSPKLTELQIKAIVLNYTENALISIGTATTPEVVVIQSSPAVFPNPLSVTVTYTYSGFGFGPLLSAFNVPITMSSTTTMANE